MEAAIPRYESLIELLVNAEKLGLSVNLSVHNVPVDVAIDWVANGLLDAIDQGAPGNPPTGNIVGPGTQASVFLETKSRTPIGS